MKRKILAVIFYLTAILSTPVLAVENAPVHHESLIASFIITGILLLLALFIRILVIPHFTSIPGNFQLFLEQLVCIVDGIAGIGKVFDRLVAGIHNALSAIRLFFVALFKAIHRNGKTLGAFGSVALILGILALMLAAPHHSDAQTAMRDAVLHDVNRVNLFGLKEVNPGLIAAMTVTATLLIIAALIRVFIIPRFSLVPGRFQLFLEQIVSLLDGLAKTKTSGSFIGAYVFAAGCYIFVGTLFELFGLQVIASNGASVTLPAPLSDINAAICMGVMSYLIILGGGVVHKGTHGLKAALKEFSLPISMSFRLFGALLSGLLVTDLIYHYISLSFVLPVIVGVMFTLLHAIVQSYVLTMLVGVYYAEVTGDE